ncbi:MAG: uroporphyrinogen decarboxylase family protein [Candidatus Latescibacterota bacterium]
MSTPRRRLLATFDYENPDRIPVVYHPSTAGLHVHGQRLLDLFRRYPPDNPISFEGLPVPPPGTTDPDGRYHEFRRDAWGVEWEYRIFGVAGHPRRYPFASWREGRDYQFPPVAEPDSQAAAARAAEVAAQQQTYLVFDGGISLFERLHAVRPLEEVLVAMVSQDPDFLAFFARLVAYWHRVLDYLLAVGADVITFGDDWGTQTGPMVSPGLFRTLVKPRYAELMERVHGAGRRAFLHCCGRVGPLLDDFLDLGIDGYWPQITCYHAEELAQRCCQHRVAVYIHPDRQHLVPLGTPAQIDAYIRTFARRHRRLGGGGIFYVEMENDAPWENVQALIEAIHRYR